MLILDIDPEEIKNPYFGHETLRNDYAPIQEAACEDGMQAILSHAHEVNIDEAERKWRIACFDTPNGEAIKPFSQFLQSELEKPLEKLTPNERQRMRDTEIEDGYQLLE